MKKLVKFFISVLLVSMLFSCLGVESPVMTAEKPFIVYKVEIYDTFNATYSGNGYRFPISQFWARSATIIAPKGMFNIGDTIRVYIKPIP